MSTPSTSDRPTFALRSYGCQMNDLDAEYMDGLLRAAGWERVDAFESADAIVVNTCAVRGGAEDRALGRLAGFKALKSERRQRGPVIVLAGCVAQKEGAALLERYPHLDIVVGTRDWPGLTRLIERAQAGERVVAIDAIDRPYERPESVERVSRVKAYVEIMVGCDNFCSYCVVPHTRGREISRPVDDVIDELRRLAEQGYREVTLIGQNVNSYRGADPQGGDGVVAFPDLLRQADRVDGLERLRFITSNPHDLTDDLIDAMAGCDKVCESIHLPAQSGSDRVLELMNRRYTSGHYRSLVEKMRDAMPEIAITTDLIVGFPSETDDDFAQTRALQEAVRWDAAFTFMYSPRPGTKAFETPDDVSPETKQQRVAELIERQETISGEKNARLIGQRLEVLVENVSRRNDAELIGRARSDKPVVFPGNDELIGETVMIEVDATAAHTLRGKLVD